MTGPDPSIDPSAPPSGPGCLECEQQRSWWFHLRRCAACGHIGCCDDSLGRHATEHHRSTGHPIIRSFEPEEDWFYDYRSDQPVEGPTLVDPQHHPLDQSTPGPAERVPDDWEAVLVSHQSRD